jgi:hypothetical protein
MKRKHRIEVKCRVLREKKIKKEVGDCMPD